MKNRSKLFTLIILLSIQCIFAQEVLVEAESFDNPGGWVIDPQFEQQMGSPYLLAHGIGKPVKNASTIVKFESNGVYHVWVRTKNWVPGEWEAPGQFQIKIDNQQIDKTLGLRSGWGWEYVDEVSVSRKEITVELVDLTGFDGRVDAIYFSTSKIVPPAAAKELAEWRKKNKIRTQCVIYYKIVRPSCCWWGSSRLRCFYGSSRARS